MHFTVSSCGSKFRVWIFLTAASRVAVWNLHPWLIGANQKKTKNKKQKLVRVSYMAFSGFKTVLSELKRHCSCNMLMKTALFKQVAFGEWYKCSRNKIASLRRQSRICPIGLALSVFNRVLYLMRWPYEPVACPVDLSSSSVARQRILLFEPFGLSSLVKARHKDGFGYIVVIAKD